MSYPYMIQWLAHRLLEATPHLYLYPLDGKKYTVMLGQVEMYGMSRSKLTELRNRSRVADIRIMLRKKKEKEI